MITGVLRPHGDRALSPSHGIVPAFHGVVGAGQEDDA